MKLLVALLLAGSEAVDGGSAPAASAHGFVSYVEWVLNISMSAAERAEAEGLAARATASSNPDDRRLVARAAELEAERASYPPEELAGLRSSVEDEYLKTLRSRHKGSQVAQWILQLKGAASRPIASGKPALTRHVADCLAELAAFVVTEASGARVSTDLAARDTFARLLAAGWPKLSPEQRAAVAAVPGEWARTRSLWSGAGDEQRAQLREEWRALAGPAAPVAIAALVEVSPRVAIAAAGWR